MLLKRNSHPLPRVQKVKGIFLFLCAALCLWAIITLRNLESLLLSEALDLGTGPEKERYAFATLLTGEGDVEFPDVEEPYLRAARLLTFQLLHNPRTRNETFDAPFLVLVTPDVPERHREILTNDGATVIPVESVARDWIRPKWSRWNDVLAKLNLWQLTDYDKIMFLDADSVIFHPIHDIFTHPAAEIRQTLPLLAETPTNSSVAPSTGNPTSHGIPTSYMIAGIHDPWVERALPPVPGSEFYAEDNYMNAGFFILHPSKDIFNYYSALLDTPDAFDSAYPEQNLLNCAHRTDGRMPWQDFGSWWNLKGGFQSDYEHGLKSIHHKWWRPIPDQFISDRISDALEEMEAFFHGRIKSHI